MDGQLRNAIRQADREVRDGPAGRFAHFVVQRAPGRVRGPAPASNALANTSRTPPGTLSAYTPAPVSSKNEVLSVPFALARYIALSAWRIRACTSRRSSALLLPSMRTPMLADTATG
ncbi:hypothetical protein OKW40_001384 [Paraburkholderia sp. RAU6.4a]